MPFKRKLPTRPSPIANVIVVEGKRREFRYFGQAALSCSGPPRWTVVSADGGDPKSLLAKISEYQRDDDRVFVVFDGDRMPPNCEERESAAWSELQLLGETDQRVHLIQSYPCFEVWLLWHFKEKLPAATAIASGTYTGMCGPFKRRLVQLMPELDRPPYDDWRKLQLSLQQACARARKDRTAKVQPLVYSDVDLLIREMGLD